MTSERVTRYFDELRRALRPQGVFSAQVVEELHDHLIDAIEGARTRGLTDDAAEREAIARCGPADVIAAHVAAGVPRLRRRMLLAICIATMLATAFLSLSLLIFRPPRANYWLWSAEAALFALQGAVTIVVLQRGSEPSTPIRALLTTGGIALAIVGANALYSIATSHFEGYGLLLGTLLIFQGALTIAYFRRRRIQLATATMS